MRKASFAKNHEEFDNWINFYGEFVERIVGARKVVRTKYEKMELLEAFVLRLGTRWEHLVEQDIIVSLNRDPSSYADALGLRLRKHLSRDECEAILVGPRYLDFKSVGDVKSFGRKYLAPNLNPFEAVTPAIGKRIDEFILMRNFLAHYSGYARRAYYAHMRATYEYERVPEPGAFLIASLPRRTAQRWVSYYLNFYQASRRMLRAVEGPRQHRAA